MGYAGMVMDLANALSSLLGNAYIAIAPLIGGIGCFVTGSATSASVMFATLQQSVAQQLGINEIWLVAANGAGATAGKMILHRVSLLVLQLSTFLVLMVRL